MLLGNEFKSCLKGSCPKVSNRHRRVAIFLIVVALVVLFASSSAFCEENADALLIDRALAAAGMTRADLGVRPDLFDNPYAISIFKHWMGEPLKAPGEAQRMADSLLTLASKPSEWLGSLAGFGDVVSSGPMTVLNSREEIPHTLPEPLKKAVKILLDAIYTANKEMSAVKEAVSPETLKLLERYLYPDAAIKGGKITEDPARIRELRLAVKAIDKVDLAKILGAGDMVLKAVEDAEEILTGPGEWKKTFRTFSFHTGLGHVVIGGAGPDIHQGEASLIIDIGGNDIYKGRIASGKEGKTAIVLDLEGDDVYIGGDFTQGAGFWGVGVLVDCAGNDLYQAKDMSQGAGFFGIGLLIDLKGSDIYLGGANTQAASSFGWGGLIDLEGDDTYQCRQFGQAFAGVRGGSSLCDVRGNDRYLSGIASPDPREPDMDQSFSQGFASGMRNIAAGGFALLADCEGNDLYQCRYFGQGAAYWMGVGVLYDRTGKDVYTARRYAQGAGIHYAFGMLLDVAGNDHTASWGVSQGCGHDYGTGILVNGSGNDTYTSSWLSMGASKANGIGIFVDNSGDDGYETLSGLAVASIEEDRRSGGIGLFIDAGGKDRYSSKGANNKIWVQDRWGIGADEENKGLSGVSLASQDSEPMEREIITLKKEEEKAHLKKLLAQAKQASAEDVETLLDIASHWGLETEIQKESEDRLFLMDPMRSVPAVADLLDTPDVMSLLFLDRFFKIYGYHAGRALIKKCETDDPLVKARALYYLGILKDSKALTCVLRGMANPSWRVRFSAIRAIGEILDKDRLDVLGPMQEALNRDDPSELKSYLMDRDKIPMLLSVLSRAVPIGYDEYQRFSLTDGQEERIEAFVRAITGRYREQMVTLIEQWIRDINNSGGVAIILMPYLDDPEPAVRRATAYTLGQMRHKEALPGIAALLKDPSFGVRDIASLSLALFKEEAVPILEEAFLQGPAGVKILGMDVLSHIPGEAARSLVAHHLSDPDENVREAAGRACRGDISY